MERRKIHVDCIQLFPRTVERGLAPQHVEQTDFVAECRHIEGYGEAWLLYQQKPPHLVAHVQFTNGEADFDLKLGTVLAMQKLHAYIDGDLTFFCMLARINQDEVPSAWPDRIQVPVRAVGAAARWWHEYGRATLAAKNT